MWSRKCPVGEMFVRGNVLVGKCPVGEVSGREIFLSGKYPSGKCQSGNCPHTKKLINRDHLILKSEGLPGISWLKRFFKFKGLFRTQSNI